MSSEIYIFAGGGTGGHLYPGLAVAEELGRLRPEAKIVFACSSRPIDRRILDPLEYAIVPQPVRALPQSPLQVWPFLRGWFASKAMAKEMIGDLKPQAVLGLGGFAAAPVMKAAGGANIKTAMLNPDAVPGKANRFLAKCANIIFTQFEATADSFKPSLRDNVRCVGCPIRAGLIGANRDEAMQHFDLRDDRKTLLVNGGSQGAQAINDAISVLAASDSLAELAERWQILHITGPEKTNRTPNTSTERISVRKLDYCDRMDLALAACDLAVCRGGASTVAELSATATPAVILPYPYHRDRQQLLNARGLTESGASVVCEDKKQTSLNVAELREVMIPIMRDSSRLEEMQTAAKKLAKPQAARIIAEWMIR